MAENKCPYSGLHKNNNEEGNVFKIIKNRFLLISCFLLIVAPILSIFYSINQHQLLTALIPIGITWLLLTITTLNVYSNRIRAQFRYLSTDNTQQQKSKIPLCGIFNVFFDVFCRRKIALREIDVERQKKYGDMYLSFFGLRPTIIVTTANLAEVISKDIINFAKSDPRELNMPFFYDWVGNNNIVLANGNRWKEVRKLIHPVLNKVDLFMPVMTKKIIAFCNQIELEIAKSPNNSAFTEIKLTRWLKALSLDVAGEALFGYDFNHLNESANPGIDATDYVLNEIFSPLRVALPIINKLPLHSNKRLKEAIHVLDALVSNMISYYSNRLQNSVDSDDNATENVLSLLLKGKENELLSTHELRNNILALVLASHETTQVSLSGVLYFLAKHPNLQEKLRKESIALFPDLEDSFSKIETLDKRDSQYWKLKTFKNLENFILESLRLYSPLANQNPRTTIRDVTLNGYKIPKGTLVIMNLHAIHMNECEWSTPDHFDPDRFNKEERGNKFAFLPFGNGPRICSGRDFSLMEQKLALCFILRKFEIKLPDDNYVVPMMRYSFTGLPDETYHLYFRPIS